MKDKVFTLADFKKWGSIGGNITKKNVASGKLESNHYKNIRKKVKRPGPKPSL